MCAMRFTPYFVTASTMVMGLVTSTAAIWTRLPISSLKISGSRRELWAPMTTSSPASSTCRTVCMPMKPIPPMISSMCPPQSCAGVATGIG